MATGLMEKGTLGTQFNATHLISPVVSKQNEKRHQKTMSHPDGIKDGSLASWKRLLDLNVFL